MPSPRIFALAACTMIACGAPVGPRSVPTLTAAPATVTAPPTGADASSAATLDGALVPAPRCHLTVTETQGCEPPDVETLLAPARSRIEGCRGPSGGKLRIHVRQTAGKLAFDITPDSSLDPKARQCVLDALSTLHADESSTAWSGLYVRPTGFTSLITIEW